MRNPFCMVIKLVHANRRWWAGGQPLRYLLRPLIPKQLRDAALRRVTASTEEAPIAPRVRRCLIEIYRQDIPELQEPTRRDRSGWLHPERERAAT